MSGNKPIKEIRLGQIKAAIWQNGDADDVRYSVQLSKIYKRDDKWESTQNFTKLDLPLVAKVADLTHTYLYEPKND